MLRRMDSSLFNWLTWRNGTIFELFAIKQRKLSLIKNKYLLKKYAIGYSPAENIPCRPKENNQAVMFFIKEREFWTHITNEEFDIIFKKE